MSKTEEKEKVVIDVDDDQLLQELDIPELMTQFKKLGDKQHKAEAEAAEYKKDKMEIGETICDAAKAVKADALTFKSGRKLLRATVVKISDDATETSQELFNENLMKIGKLDAPTIALVYRMSQVPLYRRPYIKMTTSGGDKKDEKK